MSKDASFERFSPAKAGFDVCATFGGQATPANRGLWLPENSVPSEVPRCGLALASPFLSLRRTGSNRFGPGQDEHIEAFATFDFDADAG